MEDPTLTAVVLNMLETRFVKSDEMLSDMGDDITRFEIDLAAIKEQQKIHANNCPMKPAAIEKIVLDTIKIYLSEEPDKKLQRTNGKMNLWFMGLSIFIALCSLVTAVVAIYHSVPQ